MMVTIRKAMTTTTATTADQLNYLKKGPKSCVAKIMLTRIDVHNLSVYLFVSLKYKDTDSLCIITFFQCVGLKVSKRVISKNRFIKQLLY